MLRIAMLFAKEFNFHPVVYRQAKTLMDAGHEVTVYAWDRSGKRGDRENVGDIPVVNIHAKASYGKFYEVARGIAGYYSGLLRTLKASDYDVIHTYDQHTLPIAVLISRLHGKPLVYDVLDIYYLDMKEGFVRNLIHRADTFLSGRAARIKVPCDSFVEHYRRPEKTVVVWNCPEKDRFYPVRANKQVDTLTIGHFGNLRWSEPFRLLFESTRGLPGIRIMIGGEGICEEEIRRIAEGREDIRIEGHVPFDMVPERYRNIDVLYVVYPDNHAPIIYSIPMKIFEAMACGIPVIVNDRGYTAEFVRRHGIGVTVNSRSAEELKEAIEYLKRNPEIREEMGRRGRTLVEMEYNWENMSKRFLSIYDEIERDLYRKK